MKGDSVYKIVTDKIIEKLEAGTVPWRQPWTNAGAVSWDRQRPYRGLNAMLLDAGEYATWNQIKKAGGKVKKGEKGHLVTFWKWLEKKEEGTEEVKRFPMFRYYKVWEINSQVEGMESKRKTEEFDHDPIQAAEAIIKGYRDCPPIAHKPGRACYSPCQDTISIPPLKDFCKVEEYYSTAFHEAVHSTGHVKRLARPGVMDSAAAFGSETYSKEELVAEIGASMLCGVVGIDNTLDNAASYISSWIQKLKEDNRLIVTAASQAQKAADYIQGISYE